MSENLIANHDKMYKLLEKAIPSNAVDYCFDIWLNFPFHFKINKDRRTKLGDYRFHHNTQFHVITINQGLNPYAFLITYIHEVAHRITMEEHGRKVSPHGKEWKQTYGTLLQALLSKNIFPKDIIIPLVNHINQPKASSCADPVLYQVLKKYDPEISSINTLLKSIKTGEKFIFRDKTYIKEVTKRTRALCKEVATGKKWLIPLVMEVGIVRSHS
jgi:hypothetical protein